MSVSRFPASQLASRAPRRFDAAAFLTVYAALLFLVPANLVFQPLGAVGTPANVFGIVGMGWWTMTRMVPSLGIASGLQPIRIATAVFGLSVLASYVAFAMRSATPAEFTAADMGVLLVLAWAGPALVAADGLMTRADVDRLLKRVCVFGAMVASLGIIEFFTGFEVRTRLVVPGLVPNHELGSIAGTGVLARVAGTATHPIEFGVVLAVLLPIAVHYALAAPRSTARRWWFVVALIGVAIPMALSRSAILGVMGAAIVMLAGWSWHLRSRALLAMLGFLFVMQGAIPGLLGTLRSLFANLGTDDSIRGRTDDYDIVGRFIAERPFFGRGFQTFGTSFLTLDNQFLGIIIELGFVGLAAFLVFMGTAFFTARGARRRSSDTATRNLAQALAAGIFGALIGFLTFDVFGYSMISGTIFLLAGCAGALWRIAGHERPTPAAVGHVPHPAVVS